MSASKKIYDIIIVGAGASGLLAGALLAQSGLSILILEKNEKVGKKLLATGSGRCNFTNLNMSSEKYYCDDLWIGDILQKISPQVVIKTFENMGVYHMEKDGYVYPYTNQASTLVDGLIKSCKNPNVKIKCNNTIYAINIIDNSGHAGSIFQVTTASNPQMENEYSYYSKNLILAMGGQACPSLGGSLDQYNILKKLDYEIIEPKPALVGLKPDLKNRFVKEFMKNAAGVRARGKVGIATNEQEIWGETGQIQFVKDGISGIEVFQLSHIFSESLEKGKETKLLIDFVPEMEDEKLERWFEKNHAFGLVPDKLVDFIHSPLDLKRFEFDIISTFGFEKSQVTSGGIDINKVDNSNFQSKIHENLFILGELLDVDGMCGGYNLHFAWSSAILASKYIMEREKKHATNFPM